MKLNHIYVGNCLDVMKKEIPDNSTDLILTDFPYGYSFMNNSWDIDVPSVEICKEFLRVLKHGHFLATTMSARLDLQFETTKRMKEAGFEISFMPLLWGYNNGLSKAMNIAKHLDRKADHEIKHEMHWSGRDEKGNEAKSDYKYEPITENAKKLNGFYTGYNPKPVYEPVLIYMKSLEKDSYTKQAIDNFGGSTCLDAVKIPSKEGDRGAGTLIVSDNILKNSFMYSLDKWFEKHLKLMPKKVRKEFPFIFVSKPTTKERDKGLEQHESNINKSNENTKLNYQRRFNAYQVEKKNIHPTVKPQKLYNYLLRLFLGNQKNKIVLDPFCGSGTTPMACKSLSHDYIGIEIKSDYAKQARDRIKAIPRSLLDFL